MNASAHIPDDSDLKEFIVQRSKAHSNKVSAYVRHLIEQDQAGNVSIESKTPIQELARVFHPTLLSDLDAYMEFDERRVIARFLEALREAILRDGFNPEAPFALYNSADQMAALLAAKPGGPELLRQMRDFAFSQPVAVAEGQAPYQPPETSVKDAVKKHQAMASRAARKSASTPPKQ